MKRRALFIGVDKYTEGLPPLSYACNDASKLRDFFQGAGYETDVLRDASTSEMLDRIENLTRDLTKDDLFLFFFAGHGFTTEHYEMGGARKLGRQLAGTGDRRWRLQQGKDGLGLDDLKIIMGKCGCPCVAVLDACQTRIGMVRAGDGPMHEMCTQRDLTAICEVVSRYGEQDQAHAAPFVVINSCSVGEVSYELKEERQGLFSWALLKVLKSIQDGEESPLFDNALVERIVGQMKVYGRQFPQHPTFFCSGVVDGSYPDVLPSSQDEFVFLYDTRVPFRSDTVNCLSVRIEPKVPMTEVCIAVRPRLGSCDVDEVRPQFDEEEKCWCANFDIRDLRVGNSSCDIRLTCRIDGFLQEFLGSICLLVLDREEAIEPVRSGEHGYVRQRLSPQFSRKDVQTWRELPKKDKLRIKLQLNGDEQVFFFAQKNVKVGVPCLKGESIFCPHDGIMIEPPQVGTEDADGTRFWKKSSDKDGPLAVYQRISRMHCEFLLGKDGQPKVKDLGSSNGTFGSNGHLSIRLTGDWEPISDGELTLGSRADSLKMRVRLFGGAKGKGLCLTRTDGPIHYVLLWDSFDLGVISPDYQGCIVTWDCKRGIFLLALGKGVKRWLLPGCEIQPTYFASIIASKVWDK